MANYFKERVLRCAPNGSITKLEAQAMHTMVSDCLESLTNDVDPTAKCSRLLAVAEICISNGYYCTAIDLCQRVIEVSNRTMYRHNSYRCLTYCYKAARHIDAIRAKTSPGEKWVSEYARQVYRGMSNYDDTLYCEHNIDDYAQLMRIKNYALRHKVIDPDTWREL
jgi:hypothetical protein